MKRIITAGLVLLMVGLVGAPGYTMETKVEGDFTINGVLNTYEDDDDEGTMTYREMAVEIRTTTQVNEKIKVMTETAILDKKIDGPDTNVGDGGDNEDDNIQIEKFWMDIVTPVGLLSLGRMEISTWGTTFYDDGDSGDRIRLNTPFTVGNGRLFVTAIAEKAHEGSGPDDWTTNRDNDKYYLAFTYATKSYRTGLLLGHYPYGTFLGSPAFKANFSLVSPYYSGMIGPLMVNAELDMLFGDYTIRATDTENDISTMCYWLEVGYPMGSANVELGYYYMSGDDTPAASGNYDKIENAGLLGRGEDWEKVFILTSDDHGMSQNILNTGDEMNMGGMSMFYLAADYDVNDSFNVYGLVAMATADEVLVPGADDSIGTEIDLGFNWKIMDNLEYNGRAGYLMGGDWWEEARPISTGQTDLTVMALYHEVVLTF